MHIEEAKDGEAMPEQCEICPLRVVSKPWGNEKECGHPPVAFRNNLLLYFRRDEWVWVPSQTDQGIANMD